MERTEKELYNELFKLANAARAASYCPYSGFSVGAALLTKSEKIYTGVNIENSSFTPTVCAERVAFFKAVSDGEREFAAIAIAGGKFGCDPNESTPPCGVCRQVMGEFADSDLKIILSGGDTPLVYTLGELLPMGFDKASLGQ